MSDVQTPPPPDPDQELPQAQVRGRRMFSAIWAIPIVAALVAGFLGWQAINARGPEITITFKNADGLQAGQTKVKFKSVDLGTVRSITLTPDLHGVEVRVQMQREATPSLTSNARFWVVRPRLTAGNISGLDTLVSGAYIGMDPGAPGSAAQRTFVGLEEPPAIRSDEPGTTYLLKADRIGSLGSGSPVIFRDIKVGEVLGYDLGKNGDGVTLHVFVSAPYDAFVHTGTQFWNASGLSIDLGAQGLRLRLENLLAALAGGIAFDTRGAQHDTPIAHRDTEFTLYADAETATSAGFKALISARAYFDQSVRGLAVGAPVEMYGLQVGAVTAVTLDFNAKAGHARVVVDFNLQPERIFPTLEAKEAENDAVGVAQRLVDNGMRVQLASANLLTGQMLLSLAFEPSAERVAVAQEDGKIVLPSLPGGFDGLMAGAGAIMQKLNALPLQEIANNLNATLKSANAVANGPELHNSLVALSEAMTGASALIRSLQQGVTPAAKQLPGIVNGVQTALDRANRLLGSANAGYGADSPFRRDLERLLGQVSEASRSIRLLADYLNQHPDALLRGRTGRTGN